MTELDKLCKNPECEVRESGHCQLGHDPVELCPNYAGDSLSETVPSVQEPLSDTTLTEISTGDVMHLEDLSNFCKTVPIRCVALIGEQQVGKTTLLASIYEMYCKGPFAGLRFSGSRTLVGFAKRHHLALLNSARSSPSTPRTSRGDPVSFFHLALTNSDSVPVHLVFSDRSGEAYGDARADTALISGLPEFGLANRACFLLDCGRLASKEKRAAYSRQFKQMIHALHDNGALRDVKAVEVLATKFDITKKGDVADQLEFLTAFEKSLVQEFADRGLQISCYRVCALPKSDHKMGFHGLDDAVKRWTELQPIPNIRPTPVGEASRQIDRLLAKS